MFISAKLSKMIFAIPFAIFGLFHFMNGSKMAGMVPSFIPGGGFWIFREYSALLEFAMFCGFFFIFPWVKKIGKRFSSS